MCPLNTIKYYWCNIQSVFTKYNHLQPPDAAAFCHGGCNSLSSHVFLYKKHIHFFRGLTLRHMYVVTKNKQKVIFQLNEIIHLKPPSEN